MQLPKVFSELTELEVKVLYYKTHGLSPKDIAQKIHKKEGDVSKIQRSALDKLLYTEDVRIAWPRFLNTYGNLFLNMNEATLKNWPEVLKKGNGKKEEVVTSTSSDTTSSTSSSSKPSIPTTSKDKKKRLIPLWVYLLIGLLLFGCIVGAFGGIWIMNLLNNQPEEVLQNQENPVSPANTSPSLLFEDDFSDGFDRSKYVLVDGSPIWADGSIRADQPVDLFIGDATWTNYEVRVEMKNLDSCPSRDRQKVGVRAQDGQNWVGVVTRNCGVAINSYREGNETELLELDRIDNPWKFTLRVEDNMLSYVGESRVQIDDFLEGGGVYVHLEGEIILDSIRVTSLP